jgi:hypothetical protein
MFAPMLGQGTNCALFFSESNFKILVQLLHSRKILATQSLYLGGTKLGHSGQRFLCGVHEFLFSSARTMHLRAIVAQVLDA